MKEIEITVDEKKIINQICAQYGHDQNNSIVARNICLCLRAEKDERLKFGRNNTLLADLEVMSFKEFPSAPMSVMTLIGYYKTPRTNAEMPSGQVAKQAQTLRDIGFVFRTGKKSDGTTKNNYTFKKEDGKEYREIIDFDPKAKSVDNNWCKLTKKEKAVFRAMHKIDFLGDACQPKDRQFDHRIPQEVRKRNGLPTVRLTAQSLRDGSYDNDFQVTTGRTNCRKREICNNCLKGEIIELPPSIEPFRSAYRQKLDEDANYCQGCFWHNYLMPKDEGLCSSLVQARDKHRKEVEEVQNKLQ